MRKEKNEGEKSMEEKKMPNNRKLQKTQQHAFSPSQFNSVSNRCSRGDALTWNLLKKVKKAEIF